MARCRHTRKQALFGNGSPELLKDDTTLSETDLRSVSSWCSDCGALQYWNDAGSRQYWKLPQSPVEPATTQLADGWGIVDMYGDLWPDVQYSRRTIQEYAEGICATTWKKLYRMGYRCIKVRVVPR